MKIRFGILCISTIVSALTLHAQLKPYGLDGKVITCLAAEARDYGSQLSYASTQLYAGTNGDGVFSVASEKEIPNWISLKLDSSEITALSVQHFGYGPKDGLMLFAGVVPNYQKGDSTLIYSRIVTTPAADTMWTASDSGIDRQKFTRVNALNSYYFTGHTPPQPVMMSGNRGMYQGAPLGKSWTESSVPAGSMFNSIDVNPHWFGTLAWAAGSYVGREPLPAAFRSTDAGKTWTPFLLPTYRFGEASTIAINPRSMDSVFAGFSNAIWVTHDSGASWRELLSSPNTTFTAIAVDPTAPENVFAGGIADSNGFVFFHSKDGGRSWTRIMPIPAVYAAGVSSLVIVQTKAPATVVFIGTRGSGVWRYEPSTTFVISPGVFPARFLFEQNYPNPFNGGTVFSYQSSVVSRVRLRIFDLLGREVVTLVNEEKDPGSYAIRWDAADFPAGVYFYQLKADDFLAVRRMVLVK